MNYLRGYTSGYNARECFTTFHITFTRSRRFLHAKMLRIYDDGESKFFVKEMRSNNRKA